MYMTKPTFRASLRSPGAMFLSSQYRSSDYLGPSTPTDEAAILKQDLNSRPQCVYSIEDFKNNLLHYKTDDILYTYALLEDKNCVLLKCKTNKSKLAVPNSFDGHIISAIASSAFYKLNALEELVLPKYAACIGRRAIFSCKSLKKLVLPQEIDMFSSSWIKDASSIEDLVLPRRLKFFPAGVFNSCRPRFLDFGADVAFIAPDAFVNSSLEKISVDPNNKIFSTDGHALYSKDESILYALATPMKFYKASSKTRQIASRAFAYMSALDEVELPQEVYEICSFAFMCSGLKSFKAPKNLKYIGDKAFLKCINLDSCQLNDALEYVSTDTFEDSNLKALKIPASLRNLGFHAFWNTPLVNENINNLVIDSKNPYMYINNQGTLYRLQGLYWYAAEQLDINKEFLSIDEGTYGIDEQAFARINTLTEVKLPESLEYIGSCAFYACSNLKTINLPPRLKFIGEKALCLTAIESIHIPASLKDLGHLALSTYKNTAIIGERALRHITVDEENKIFFIESGLLMRRQKDGSLSAVLYAGNEPNVHIPKGTTCIEAHCFAGVEEIENLQIPKSVKSVQSKAFNITKAFKSITVELPYDIADVRMHHTPLGPPRVEWVWDCKSEDLIALQPQHSTQLYLKYPQTRSSVSAITYAFLGDEINPATLVHYLDAHVSRADNLHFWAMHMLSRLKNPVLLDEAHASLMKKRIYNNLEAIISDFARCGTIEGFEYLFELGYFDEQSIQQAIDISSQNNNAHSTSYLLELQQENFARSRIDFEI